MVPAFLRLTACLMLLGLAAAGPHVTAAEVVWQRTPHAGVEDFSADGKWLALASAWIDDPGVLKLRDLTTGQERLICKDHSDAIVALAFAPDGTQLASGDWRGQVKIWDTSTGKQKTTFQIQGSQVWSLAFSPDGKMLASSEPRELSLWEVATGKKRAALALPGKRRGAVGPHAGYCVAFSPDGRTLACGADDGVVRLWDLSLGNTPVMLTGHSEPVLGIAFAPDSKTLASTSRDGSVRLWNVAAKNLKATFLGHVGSTRLVAFSADGRMLASWSHGNQAVKSGGKSAVWIFEVKVWEIASGKKRLSFSPEAINVSNHYWHPFPMQFTRTGQHLVTYANGTVKHWDLAELALRSK